MATYCKTSSFGNAVPAISPLIVPILIGPAMAQQRAVQHTATGNPHQNSAFTFICCWAEKKFKLYLTSTFYLIQYLY